MSSVLVSVYVYHLKGRDIQIEFAEDLFDSEQYAYIGRQIVEAWRTMAKGNHGFPTPTQTKPKKKARE